MPLIEVEALWLATEPIDITAISATPMRHHRLVPASICTGVTAECSDRGPDRRERPGQTRLKISVPLVPPNPKLFFIACSIRIGRASLAQ